MLQWFSTNWKNIRKYIDIIPGESESDDNDNEVPDIGQDDVIEITDNQVANAMTHSSSESSENSEEDEVSGERTDLNYDYFDEEMAEK